MAYVVIKIGDARFKVDGDRTWTTVDPKRPEGEALLPTLQEVYGASWEPDPEDMGYHPDATLRVAEEVLRDLGGEIEEHVPPILTQEGRIY